MRIVILNADYPPFLQRLYSQHAGLESLSYAEQMAARNDSLFGVADYYSRNFRKLGHEAWEIHANNEAMQRQWGREHGLNVGEAVLPPREPPASALRRLKHWAGRTPLRRLRPLVQPLRTSAMRHPPWFHEILSAQIAHYRPDVLLNQAMDYVLSGVLAPFKHGVRVLAGQIAAPLPAGEDYSIYDLVLSSLPNYVDFFQKQGIRSRLNRLAFEPAILPKIPAKGAPILLSFVGTLSPDHRDRIRLLEALSRNLPLEVWGQGVEHLPSTSPIRDRFRGPAWGAEMLGILHRSKITLNHHIGIAGRYANNMRLYEATGAGALLLTDLKDNLAEIFVSGEEVAVYESPAECAEKIRFYLDHEEERTRMARAGQRRTMSEHTYENRAREQAGFFSELLAHRPRTRSRMP